ncbi:hypothetical protein A2631_04120 [Candidatus Daviesbacteria bacterium RIFCSPHIGHO2_01_FULL_44_29]|uniref:AI-2E family transporter n=1 Tax=Candidatus Daviesbacteria bacterium RIFCSPHIGHO2_02_FULL_43_12 TaxID=1797776 RepID=A0A1F5KGJ2_9BACT|nr:MAG: hypothetical protein A2631_04120 [Candidatus Daviesbacteria bacterium RIFCSPHIGHO2_01_FULL_44_29]OGE39915.1 MAG: hypothetical protein A3D25_03850 [Candidatus Daviesbacteria bacterium RIFCSPHIGHO2_02_FULL_43_12]OGE40527.1 MAG: hypothetical protein A3E86_00940 [Candidatus Daviesbacteria bacterium RIFCSPHIGHO2_12_FULL_47_45]OGE70404.1 MAG: hypothetical protein A3B55_01720 [Candidatus Daviesbacteria bacterium RIFCSPLOWO2_01_FULL_43_15]
MKTQTSIDISHKTIFFIATFLGILWLLFQIKEVILILFVAIIFMSALNPIVESLTKRSVPKGMAIALAYVVLIGIIVGLLTLIITPLTAETSNLLFSLPQTIQKLAPTLGVDKAVIQQELSNASQHVLSLTLAVFSNFLTLISIAVLTFYLIIDRDRLYKLIISLSPNQKERTEKLVLKIENKLGAWLRGQVILSLVIGTMSYTLLFLLHIQYALPLSILAGLMEVVPVIGPIVSAIPAILIAYVESPALALFVGLGFFAIQQLENHFIVPQVMKRAVGLNPLIVILAIAIGGKLLGIAGGLLAVPITVVIQIILEDFLNIDLDTYSDKK